jgi:histone chaperone ASF1
VGSAQDASRDQVLDEILVGPVPVGVNKFVLQADAPDPSKLPPEDLLGVTVVLVTCSYKEREFVRVGYYVNNEYHDPNAPPQQEGEDPPALPNPIPLEHIQRQILADKPRVTKFPISWGDEPMQQQQEQPQQQQTPSGFVSMQEESNSTFSQAQGVQAMTE